MKSKLMFTLGVTLALTLAGCNSGPAKVAVEKVSLNKTSETMAVGDHLQLEATVTPENATDKTVTWSATGEGIVSVENGYVTALKAGSTTVTATTTDGGKTASCAITVVVPTTGISLDKSSAVLEIDETVTLTATVAPATATDKTVTWSVTGDAVTVNNGVVTAVKVGTATVKATCAGFSAECAVEVVSSEWPAGTYRGTVTVQIGDTPANFDLVIALGTSTNGLVAVKLSNLDAGAKSFTYTPKTKTLEVVTEGTITYSTLQFTLGKITAKYNATTDAISEATVDGTIAQSVTNNGEIAISKIATQLDCEGTDAELQAIFKRRYQSGGWQVDNNNADRIKHEDNCVSGTGAMSIRPCGTGFDAYALNLQNDISPAVTVKNLGFWVYNPGTVDVKFREWIYKGAGLTSNAEIGALTAVAGQWTYLSMGFTQAAVMNVQISVWKNQNPNGMTTRLIFDNIVLF